MIPIPVLLASDLPVLRQSIVNLLDGSPEIHVVGCAETDSDVLRLVKAYQARLAILDLKVERSGLRHLISELFNQHVRVLLMSDAVDPVKSIELLRWGANGIISRSTAPDRLYESIRAVASGEIWISQQIVNELVHHLRIQEHDDLAKSAAFSAIPMQRQNRLQLTQRELQIVKALGEGMTNRNMAAHFGISEYTVKRHLTRIFDKVGVDSRLELAMFATYHGLVQASDAPPVYAKAR